MQDDLDPQAATHHEPAARRTEDRPVPGSVIRHHITDLEGAVTTRQILEHLASNGASDAELATVASLPDREWGDHDQALAALSSGFEPGDSRRE